MYGLAGTTVGAAAIVGGAGWRERLARADAPGGPAGPGVVAPKGTAPPRRRLGRTNLQVSVVGLGAGSLEATGPVHRAVEKGINYVDTSACYLRGGSENTLGRAFSESPSLRAKVVLATKWDASARMPKERILASLDESLNRLKTDHVDVMQIHNLGDHLPGDDGFSRLDNPELYAAMDAAKRAGKVRFFGATAHTDKRAAILAHAIDKGAFDMILVKMNALDFEGAGLPALLAKAKAKDVGVVVMKSQPAAGVMPKGFEHAKWSVYQANLRWCLQQDIASVVHTGIGNDEAVQDVAIGAVYEGLGLRDDERELLERYASALSPQYCRGCSSTCTTACPDGVAIPTVVRALMYERDYGSRAMARDAYDALSMREQWSSRCLACAKCDEACPYGVDASGRVRAAREILGPGRA